LLEEVIAKGGKKFVFFGSCGTLDKELPAGHLIVPVAAYRDEGTSYHYAPVSDYIEIETAERVSEILSELNLPHVRVKLGQRMQFIEKQSKIWPNEKERAALL